MTTAREAFHSSESNEWYTPAHIVEAARRVMGQIDLDPASSAAGNETVRATHFYDAFVDGLSMPWHGNIWLNPPYGRGLKNRSNQDIWSEKLLEEHAAGRVEQACLLVKATPSEHWFQRLYPFPICFTRGRVSFLDETGTPIRGNAHGSAIVGIGVDRERFVEQFNPIGTVVERHPLSTVIF